MHAAKKMPQFPRHDLSGSLAETGEKRIDQVDFLNECLLLEWRRFLARTRFLWPLVTALRLL
jgi:hypothetical protein